MWWLGPVLVFFCWVILGSPAAAQSIDFSREIRPILAEHCFACHGPDAAARQAELRLDIRQEAIDAGAIVPHNPEASDLVDRIRTRDRDLMMPPAEFPKRLSSEQKKLLERWIREGASYREHWAWTPPQQPPLPDVNNAGWVRNPIDRFVAAKLESLELSPAPEADLPTLLRRVTFDLTGLPPDPAKVREVLSDPRDDRYERYVDWLLMQPQWGEHRARYWLDYARYADTHGIHFDNFREMWAYRDWLIDAFNRNLSFDQFTIEQLAGDLLPGATLDQRVATGFNRCNITTNEGGVIEEEYRVLYARDRVETTMLVWNGLTMGCAVCHDHKYDPFTMRDFYQLAAFFNNTTQPIMDGNIKDTPPTIFVALKEDREAYDAVVGEQSRIRKEMEHVAEIGRADFAQRLSDDAALRENLRNSIAADWPDSLLYWPGPATDGPSPVDATQREPGYVGDWAWKVSEHAQPIFSEAADFERDQSFSVSMWIRPAGRDGAVVARMDDARDYRGWDVWLQGGYVAMHLIHRWPQNALKITATESPLEVGRWYHVAVTYDGSTQPSGVRIIVDGRPLTTRIEQSSLSRTTRTEVPLRIGSRNRTSRIDGSLIQELRIFSSVLPEDSIARETANQRAAFVLNKSQDTWSEAELADVTEWYLLNHYTSYRELRARLVELSQQEQLIRSRGTVAHVMHERDTTPTAQILIRGEYNRPSEEVTPDTPSLFQAMPDDYPRNRLGLALWLLDEQHPLTARVTVNRFWQEVFGCGLVPSSGDFGTMGQLPSNQELLDYLAVWFREHQWDVQALFRLMVTSATYRQSATLSADTLRLDPENEFLSRGPRFRLDAEMIRDNVLAVSGVLNPAIGGPSVRPYQPSGVWEAVAMPESNTRSYVMDSGEQLYRRSMYTFWKRAAPPAAMEIFNAPSREVCTVRRERTNTPLQALALLNDTQAIEAARVLAENVITEMLARERTEKEVIDDLSWRLLARQWTPEELAIVARTLRRLQDQFTADRAGAESLVSVGEWPAASDLDPVQVAAWTMLINQLMNLDEFVNK